ncbi:hypothetical protein PIB30_040111 [Stylosanthes scabra]|uniref:Uncharacterized protein n=1 Tax=Stylosanthes scabra TaxID=79078 RepID=A0ABU6REL1_9FABA|nr:hypothetical protein [Stylosanthes scabra]
MATKQQGRFQHTTFEFPNPHQHNSTDNTLHIDWEGTNILHMLQMQQRRTEASSRVKEKGLTLAELLPLRIVDVDAVKNGVLQPTLRCYASLSRKGSSSAKKKEKTKSEGGNCVATLIRLEGGKAGSSPQQKNTILRPSPPVSVTGEETKRSLKYSKQKFCREDNYKEVLPQIQHTMDNHDTKIARLNRMAILQEKRKRPRTIDAFNPS